MICKNFKIIGFNHPDQKTATVYRQDLTLEQLLKAIEKAVNEGANLFSIRGFKE